MYIQPSYTRSVDHDGFAIVPGVLDAVRTAEVLGALDGAGSRDGARRKQSVYAIRNLLDVPEVARLARSAGMRSLVEPVLGSGCFAVRGILFDKTPDANWKVAWHQDLSIAVRERREAEGFGPWSEKAGVVHVQPPAAVLKRMLTVRLHLDACGPENGPVRVIPGSHARGRLDGAGIERWRERGPEVSCCTTMGGALVMRPLILHASSPATRPGHRRVVHLEFAAEPLSGGLEWHARV